MSYLQNIGLGSVTLSPSSMRIAEAASEVVRRRKAGESEASILAFLSKRSELNRISHPCADRDGNNICSSSEIAQAISSAAAVGVQQEAIQAAAAEAAAKTTEAGAGLFTTRNIMIAGGALAVLWYLKGRK